MCGIAGFIDFNKQTDEQVISLMTSQLRHRGPDGDGIRYIQNNEFQLGLGHKRLSIIDLSTSANQPMEYKNLIIVFNGEFYNYKEIKKELEELDHSFITDSDTEVILHAFDQWGEKAVDKFIGMFAFCIYDKKSDELFIYRDRPGVKPLYYYYEDGLFLFSSELKSFHQHPSFKKEIDLDSVALFFQYGYVPQPHSIFKNTHKLLSGHFLKISLKNKEFQINKYWDVYDHYNKPKLKISEKDALDELEKILISSFKYRMIADVPVGVFLSGGYDSTILSAILQKHTTENIKTFTIGFNESKYNEATYAKETATFLGTDHNEYYCTVDDAKKVIPSLSIMYDEPFGDSSAIPTFLVSRMARNQVTVALSADGGDETFAGYDRYFNLVKNYNTLNNIPGFLQPMIGNVVGTKLSKAIINNITPKTDTFYDGLSFVLKSKSQMKDLLMVSVSKMSKNEVFRAMNNSFSVKKNFFNENSGLSSNSLDTCLAMDYKTYLVDDILTKVDRASMAVSLESREPLLDHRIIEFVAQLPENLKIKNGTTKYLLKELTHKYVPREMIDRPKKGFSIPLIEWFRKDLKPLLLNYFDEKRLYSQGIFNVSYALKNKKLYLSGDDSVFDYIWYMIVFQMWYDEWM
ncbi:asparagine synthase (glutamine-hydrolyzing) [Aquimarina megaterium]|uniref:asparagine synthase (glutamine-hydrolyzing) n=1 Tax=Aquimarina megaterium TaxID=1443666 RepID=UPI00046E56C9|nr:asparagine synthase (glutamine-hydrolyzing) [Aquimarina megaterium]